MNIPKEYILALYGSAKECTICMAAFDRPRSLPCGHTLCHDCLVNLLQASDNRSDVTIRCPFCRTTCRLLRPADLPPNYAVVALLRIDFSADDPVEMLMDRLATRVCCQRCVMDGGGGGGVSLSEAAAVADRCAVPRTFTCGHTFCEECCHSSRCTVVSEHTRRPVTTCPTCGHSSPRGAAFPVNYALVGFYELRVRRRLSQLVAGTTEHLRNARRSCRAISDRIGRRIAGVRVFVEAIREARHRDLIPGVYELLFTDVWHCLVAHEVCYATEMNRRLLQHAEAIDELLLAAATVQDRLVDLSCEYRSLNLTDDMKQLMTYIRRRGDSIGKDLAPIGQLEAHRNRSALILNDVICGLRCGDVNVTLSPTGNILILPALTSPYIPWTPDTHDNDAGLGRSSQHSRDRLPNHDSSQ